MFKIQQSIARILRFEDKFRGIKHLKNLNVLITDCGVVFHFIIFLKATFLFAVLSSKVLQVNLHISKSYLH